jgi:hypothetical protein
MTAKKTNLVRVEEWLLPQFRKQARENVAYERNKMRDVCDGMRHYVRTKEEFMAWVDEVYEAADNDYQDWLSTQ